MKISPIQKIGIAILLLYLIKFILKIVLLDIFNLRNQYEFAEILCLLITTTISIVFVIKTDIFNFNALFKNNIIFSLLSTVFIYLAFYSTTNKALEIHFNLSNVKHWQYLIQAFTTGCNEEFLCRVLIFGWICEATKDNIKIGLKSKIFLSSLIFGLLHISNLIKMDFLSVFNQICFAIIVGFLLQCLLIAFENVTLIITIHCLTNYFGMRNSKLFLIQNTIEDISFLENLKGSGLTFVFLSLIFIPLSLGFLRNRPKNTRFLNIPI